MNIEQTILNKQNHFDTAHDVLLKPTGLDASALQGVLGNIMSHQVDYADLYFQYSRSESWGLEEGKLNRAISVLIKAWAYAR